jgi:hypothetical protein
VCVCVCVCVRVCVCVCVCACVCVCVFVFPRGLIWSKNHARVVCISNVFGPTQRYDLLRMQDKFGARVRDVGGHGDSLFRAVADQLYDRPQDHAIVRKNCVHYMVWLNIAHRSVE